MESTDSAKTVRCDRTHCLDGFSVSETGHVSETQDREFPGFQTRIGLFLRLTSRNEGVRDSDGACRVFEEAKVVEVAAKSV
jgi:hypothetical protein